MKNTESLAAMAAAARAAIRDPARIARVGRDANPRFELFHAASSLCSQKARAVLHEKQLPYRSNEMIILSTFGAGELVAAEHYTAAYVRLRLRGRRELEAQLVGGYSGGSAVDTEGFDPCVVPLLVDHQEARVIADSRRICCYLDAASSGPVQLVPDDSQQREAVQRQVAIVDRIPNLALLYGFHPEADLRPEPLKQVMQTVYDYKLMALESLLAANADDPDLAAAVQAKMGKERGGRNACKDPAFQRAARERTAQTLAGLERDLASKSFPGLPQGGFSLADVLWGVNLVRMNYLGLAFMWDDLPHVHDYFAALVRRPSLASEAVQATVRSLPPSAAMDAIAPAHP